MARCTDCGVEDVSYHLINGFCEDCVEYHKPEWNMDVETDDDMDDDDTLLPLDPVVHLFQPEEW
ncbi:hypothetical protein SAMN05444673_5845 [Bacillus sp. OV166]|uniref:hypothetical protein n=1 Tax=Bacillus sp. OV166 TaxID=1882763 RepID=UPI000A2AB81A|nr:hypothetical protein [Bacillus sp. OV166]SMQ84331.1 hypothetical protein SAMN05444673_5845 [Bacillus sp. OV166]